MKRGYVYSLDKDVEEECYKEALDYLEDENDLVAHNELLNHLLSNLDSINLLNASSIVDNLENYVEESGYDKELKGGKIYGYRLEE